ncbi:52 kDa repressor of the inhibitor of the protein kinase isoform X2 [Nasonia vitripennis]|uniref:THAP-type domain-containing protein n=1 Tax=Nasonia vitripennis TaxID=7425 RepID=A0A7M7GCX8_NASVI|nr:52 kDa repressor of the inhibitor of the protein kinase isoform X2 [Nasonia vitripennis]
MKLCKCRVPNCARNSSNIGIALHRIPKNPDIRKQWIESSNLTKTVIGSKRFICSDHFKKRDYLPKRLGGRRMNLKKTAVPSINNKRSFIPNTLKSSNVKSMPINNTRCNIDAEERNELPTVESNNLEDRETPSEQNLLFTDSEQPEDCEECTVNNKIEGTAEDTAQDSMSENEVLLEIQNASVDNDRVRELVMERAKEMCTDAKPVKEKKIYYL